MNALTNLMKPDGFNVGINVGKAAGAGVAEHLHVHVIPRWDGDTNFMPLIANTGVLPEALKDIATKLRVELSK
jgi:ATP adenylyltransferase